MIDTLLTIVLVLVFAGIAVWLLNQAPFIAEPYKGIARWVILACAVGYSLWRLFGMIRGLV